MKIILTELIANKKKLFLATHMIKEEKLLSKWVKIPNTVVTDEKSLKHIFFNCGIKYQLKILQDATNVVKTSWHFNHLKLVYLFNQMF